MYEPNTPFSDIIGKTFTSVYARGAEEVIFDAPYYAYKMYHCQDCCESVFIEDICGDLDDLIGTPILSASADHSETHPEAQDNLAYTPSGEQELWTFYNIRTIKGSVTIRWYGSSEYYSVAVDFCKTR